MLTFAGEGFFLGLSLGVTCLGTCLPVILPYLFIEQRRLRSSFTSVLWFLAGRFIGYISFGAIAGALGGQVPQSYREPITGSAYIVLAALIIYNALRKRRLEPNCPAKKHSRFLSHPILFGLILGFNPCPAFLIASGRAFESGGALAGALFFAAFFVGTSVFFLPLSLFGELAKMKFFRITAKIIAVLVALWFMFIGITSIAESMRKASRPAFEIVDPIELDRIYISGDSASALYFQSLVDKSLSAELLYIVIDSIPDESFAVHFGETPDTSELMSREIGILNFSADSSSVESAVNIVKTYGFKKEPDKGFYFETGK